MKQLIIENLEKIYIATGQRVEVSDEKIQVYVEYIQKYYNQNEFSMDDMQTAFDNVALKCKYFPSVAEIVDELKIIKENKPYKMPQAERDYLMSQCER